MSTSSYKLSVLDTGVGVFDEASELIKNLGHFAYAIALALGNVRAQSTTENSAFLPHLCFSRFPGSTPGTNAMNSMYEPSGNKTRVFLVRPSACLPPG
jgi:hypothetical protein